MPLVHSFDRRRVLRHRSSGQVGFGALTLRTSPQSHGRLPLRPGDERPVGAHRFTPQLFPRDVGSRLVPADAS